MRRDDIIAWRDSMSYDEVLENCGLCAIKDDSKRDYIAEIVDTSRSLPDTTNPCLAWSATPSSAHGSADDPRQVTTPDSVTGSCFSEDEWQSAQPGANTTENGAVTA